MGKTRRAMVGATGAAVARIWPLDAFSYRELGRFGRLGDQLKQISGTLGIANSRGKKALFPGGWRYRRWFSLPESAYAGRVDLARCTEAWPLATRLEPRARRYLGDISLWQDSEAQVRRWLRPSAEALESHEHPTRIAPDDPEQDGRARSPRGLHPRPPLVSSVPDSLLRPRGRANHGGAPRDPSFSSFRTTSRGAGNVSAFPMPYTSRETTIGSTCF